MYNYKCQQQADVYFIFPKNIYVKKISPHTSIYHTPNFYSQINVSYVSSQYCIEAPSIYRVFQHAISGAGGGKCTQG